MVEWKELSEFLNFEQPTPYLVKTTEYDDSYETPVLTAGQSLLLGYTNETDGVYQASKDSPCIIFDDFTTSFHWIDYNFKVKSSAIKMLKPKENTIFRYVYYAMQQIRFVPQQHQRHWISKYSHFQIPIPSIEEQNRIVDILDAFTDSIENLKQQIAQRRKQYEYYRDQLLDLEGKEGVEMKKIEDLSQVLRGKRLTKKELDDNAQYPVYHGGIEPLGRYCKYNRDANTVMVINVGASAGTVGFCDSNFWSSDGCFCISHSKLINNKYLFYYLETKTHYLQSQVRYAGIPTLDNAIVEKIEIPLLSLNEQQRIVSILDTFLASISNLEMQLAQRQKQYEYYRNKLLTFE